MATPAEQRDVVRYPLDTLLRSEANLRLMRLLAFETEAPVSAPEAARRTGLTEAAARRALSRLVATGFVRSVGGGKSEQFELRGEEPLAATLGQLFATEQDRYQDVLRDLRTLLSELGDVRLAWIDEMPTAFGRPLEIRVVSNTRQASRVADELRTRIAAVERRLDQVIELRVFTSADAPEPAPGAVLLAGSIAQPRDRSSSEQVPHAARDDRALKMAEFVRDQLRRDPTLKVRARQHLDRLIDEGQGTATQDLIEWRQVLETYSPERLGEFLVSSSSRAQRLRQSSPFLAVLAPHDRDMLLDTLEAAP